MKISLCLLILLLTSCGQYGDNLSSQTNSDEINLKEYFFVGCVPSFSECRYSCPQMKNFYAIEDKKKCEFSETYAQIACYCKDDQYD